MGAISTCEQLQPGSVIPAIDRHGNRPSFMPTGITDPGYNLRFGQRTRPLDDCEDSIPQDAL